MTRAFHHFTAMRHEHAAAAGSDDLVAVEGEGGALAERASVLRPMSRAERLGRVFDQRDVVAPADVLDPLVVTALSVEIDTEDRCHLTAAAARATGELFLEKVRVERPGL